LWQYLGLIWPNGARPVLVAGTGILGAKEKEGFTKFTETIHFGASRRP
jgi:hypothetical protein